jgi:hypothetical protein
MIGLVAVGRRAPRRDQGPGAGGGPGGEGMKIEARLLFSREEYVGRLRAVRDRMRERGIEVLVLDETEHVFHLAGWHASGTRYHALIVPLAGEPVMVLRQLDEGPFRERTWLTDAVPCPDTAEPVEVVAGTLGARGLAAARIGVELDSHYLTVERYQALRAALPAATFVSFAGVLRELRLRKSPQEVAYLRDAARIVDQAMRDARDGASATRRSPRRAPSSGSAPTTVGPARSRRGAAPGSSTARSGITASRPATSSTWSWPRRSTATARGSCARP